jgi:hypothetical protein
VTGRLALVVLLALAGTARAGIPDDSFRAVGHDLVRVDVSGGPSLIGRIVAYEDATVTIAQSDTGAVVTVERAQLTRLTLLDDPAPATEAVVAAPVIAKSAPRSRPRVLGLGVSPLGTAAVDADLGHFHAFASTSLTLPILTAGGDDTWIAASAGGGVAIPLGKRWRADAFAAVAPLHMTSYYTYVGFGLGGGFHYTAASGLTIGFTFPILGFATRVGHSPTGYDPPFRYRDSLGYSYLAAFAGLPMFTMGYRFSWPHLRR